MTGLSTLLELEDRLRAVPDWREGREGRALLVCNRFQYPNSIHREDGQNHVDCRRERK